MLTLTWVMTRRFFRIYTPGSTNMAGWKITIFNRELHLQRLSIFQPAMLVYQRVRRCFACFFGGCWGGLVNFASTLMMLNLRTYKKLEFFDSFWAHFCDLKKSLPSWQEKKDGLKSWAGMIFALKNSTPRNAQS